MEMNVSELKNNITLIALKGTLDIKGVDQIEIKFAGYCSGENAHILVDMSGVDYLSSIGIRLFVKNAKSLRSRNGKMVLLSPTANVLNILETIDIPAIIPVYSSFESAEAVLLGT